MNPPQIPSKLDKKAIYKACENLKNSIDAMELDEFCKRVQTSNGYVGDFVSWREEAECGIEALEVMALSGDENSLTALVHVAHQITEILQQFTIMEHRGRGKSEQEKMGERRTSSHATSIEAGTVGNTIEDSLNILLTAPAKTISGLMTFLDEKFPSLPTLLYPENLIGIPKCINEQQRPELSSLEVEEYMEGTVHKYVPTQIAPDQRFETLEPLVNQLAGMRAYREVVPMARRVMDYAPVWPISASPVRELRTVQLENIDLIKIGCKLPIETHSTMGQGEARQLTDDTSTRFALEVFTALEHERLLPRAPAHLKQIEDSYRQDSMNGLLPPEQANKLALKGRPQWNTCNQWMAMAALLPPLSLEVLERWQKAGLEYCRQHYDQFRKTERLPEHLKRSVCGDTEKPSEKRIETAISNALKKGLKSLTKETQS